MIESNTCFIQEAQTWAAQQWGAVRLGDKRLDRRVVEVGARMAQRPAASLAQQMTSWAQLKAAYGLLRHPKISHARLSQPHWAATRAAMAQASVVLLVQDTSELDYTPYAQTLAGLGPIGNGRGRGLLLHTMLAVLPETRQVLGLAHQQVWQRQPHPDPTQRRQRCKAQRESRVWGETVQAVGRPPATTQWVVVADRGADQRRVWQRCLAQGVDWLLRVAQNYRLVQPDGPAYLRDTARSWAAQTHLVVEVPARPGRRARTATIAVSWGQVTIRMPRAHAPVAMWVVRAWESAPPAQSEAIDWLLTTSVPVVTAADAVQRVTWYTLRWLVEEYHQCLKTGCAMEKRDLAHAERIQRLLGFLALVAVRLLQLRQEARLRPDAAALTVIDPLRVHLVAAHFQLAGDTLTVRAFWQRVAQLGGFVGRRRDGDPGWQTLWRGWLHLDTLVQGVRLAAHLTQVTPHP
jgi:hypothetical protein